MKETETKISAKRLAKRKRLYVYVNEDEFDYFKDLAKLKTGKSNLSLLVRVLLNELAEKTFRLLVDGSESISHTGNTVIASRDLSRRGNLPTTENRSLNQEIATTATQSRNDGLNSGSLNDNRHIERSEISQQDSSPTVQNNGICPTHSGSGSLNATNQENSEKGGLATHSTQFCLRLPSDDMAYFDVLARQAEMSLNACLCMVLRGFRHHNPKLFNDEIAVLHQSNYQLSKLGVNLNQIAKQLNAMSGTSLATTQIQAVGNVINEHCLKVEKLLRENRRRYTYEI